MAIHSVMVSILCIYVTRYVFMVLNTVHLDTQLSIIATLIVSKCFYNSQFSSLQTSMNVNHHCLYVNINVPIILVAFNVPVMLDMNWGIINGHVMVCLRIIHMYSVKIDIRRFTGYKGFYVSSLI